MKKFITVILIAAITWMGFSVLSPTPVSALEDCEKPFLTFNPWYSGVVKGSDCEFKKIGVDGNPPDMEIELATFVWAIILNVLSILFGIVGYLAIGFIIFGGYQYVMARGDPGRIAKGKNTVIRAIIGLIICILASLISSLIVTIITEATGNA